MTQVSPKQLSKSVRERIKEVFYQALINIKNREQAENFYQVFLTTPEKVNLPKRLGIFILLIKGEDYSTIRDQLKVSNGTIASVHKQIVIQKVPSLEKTIQAILKERKPDQEIDDDPAWARGKRLQRTKPVRRPYRNLPF